MRDGRRGVARLPTLMGEMLTFFRIHAPIERSFDAILADPAPPIREPQRGILIAAISNKSVPLRVGHKPLCKGKWLQQDPVRWTFIVE